MKARAVGSRLAAMQQDWTSCICHTYCHLDLSCIQVSAKLFRFDALGEEFVEMASRYRELQEDLDHANFTLQEFQKAANEQ